MAPPWPTRQDLDGELDRELAADERELAAAAAAAPLSHAAAAFVPAAQAPLADRLHRAIRQIPGVHAVKKLVVTDIDSDGSARRAEVVILSTRTHMLSVSNLAGGVSGAGGCGGAASTDQQSTGALRAEVRCALAGFGVRSDWAIVEVE